MVTHALVTRLVSMQPTGEERADRSLLVVIHAFKRAPATISMAMVGLELLEMEVVRETWLATMLEKMVVISELGQVPVRRISMLVLKQPWVILQLVTTAASVMGSVIMWPPLLRLTLSLLDMEAVSINMHAIEWVTLVFQPRLKSETDPALGTMHVHISWIETLGVLTLSPDPASELVMGPVVVLHVASASNPMTWSLMIAAMHLALISAAMQD